MEALMLMAVMIEYPLVGLVPAVLFMSLYPVSTQRFLLVAAALWLLYIPYEYAMKFRILCTGECNIRIDLLLLWPLLIVVSLTALVVFGIGVWRRTRKR
jgi:hypothetical protein